MKKVSLAMLARKMLTLLIILFLEEEEVGERKKVMGRRKNKRLKIKSL